MLLEKFFDLLCKKAPLEYSEACIKSGMKDNSGIIIESTNHAEKILFALDLTNLAIMQAEKLGCDTIVTHHPAIYNPISHLSIGDETSPLVMAVKKNLNVISMHLNLDIAKDGIDDCLAKGLGAKTTKTIENIIDDRGYGRAFIVDPINAENYVERVKTEFGSNKLLYYGNKQANIRRVISFCGGGSYSAQKCGLFADLVVTSDVPHHVITYFLEKNTNLLIIPHYVAENYGFKKFCENINVELTGAERVFFMEDGRFI